MKKAFLLFATNLIFISAAFAQEFEFEVTRTPETPGFFMVRIFPGVNNAPLPIQNVFVQNYPEKENSVYAELLPFLREFGGEITSSERIQNYTESQYNRITVLGESMGNFLNFSAESAETVLEEFEKFAEKNLEPILLQNLTADFGGNVSEVFPAKIENVAFDPVFFIGKFERPLKTRMEIRATSPEGEIRAVEALHLENDKLAQAPLASGLPRIWEELWNLEHKSNLSFLKPTTWNFSWKDAFPFVLLGLGLLVIFAAIMRETKEKKQNQEITQAEKVLQPYKWNEDLPFEIERRHSPLSTEEAFTSKVQVEPPSPAGGKSETPLRG